MHASSFISSMAARSREHGRGREVVEEASSVRSYRLDAGEQIRTAAASVRGDMATAPASGFVGDHLTQRRADRVRSPMPSTYGHAAFARAEEWLGTSRTRVPTGIVRGDLLALL